MDRVVLVLGAVIIAAVVALVTGRRTDAPDSNTGHMPSLLDRSDFLRPDAPWLVAVFTSATCHVCAEVFERARHLESDEVVVQELEFTRHGDLHKRYRINAVPTLAIADSDGVVSRGFLGPVTVSELWSAIAEDRD